MRIVLLGAPGSGKRTQTMLMVERYGIPSIFTGELLRNALAADTPLSQQLKEAMEEGRSITEEVVLELIRGRLQQEDAGPGFVLDGFPRNILQAITLDELLYEMELPIELALLIDIETDVLMERLVGRRTCKACGAQYNIYSNPTTVEGVCDLCGGGLRHRADDNEETISNRLHVYDHLVSPLIKHYTRQNKLRRIDGSGEVEEVFARICEAVDSHVPPPDQEPISVSEAAIAMEDSVGDKTFELVPNGGGKRQPAVPGLDLDQILEVSEDPPPRARKKAAAGRKRATRKPAASDQNPPGQPPQAVPAKQQSASSQAKAKGKRTATKSSPTLAKAESAGKPGKASKKRAIAAKVKDAHKAKTQERTGVKKVAAKKSATTKRPTAKKKTVKKPPTKAAGQAVVKKVKKKTGSKKKSAKVAARNK